MPKYKIDENLQATFINTTYNIRGEPGDIIETDIYLPNYLPLQLIDPNNPPAIVDNSIDIELQPGQEHIVNLSKYHKRIQVSLLSSTNDAVHIFLDDETNLHTIINKELPDYVKDLSYYNLYKIRIKAPENNTGNVNIRVHLEVKM